MNTSGKDPKGMGGWLWLVVLWLAVRPVLAAMALYSLRRYMTLESWRVLTTPGSLYFNPEGVGIIGFEMVANAWFIAFSLWVLRLALVRSERFPRRFTVWLLCDVAITVSNIFLSVNAGLFGGKDLVYAALFAAAAAVGIPYCRRSRRVANTFVKSAMGIVQGVEWFYLQNGRPVGPFAEADIAKQIEFRLVNAATLVKCTGMTEWLPLGRAAGLSAQALPAVSGRPSLLAVLSGPAAIVLTGVAVLVATRVLPPMAGTAASRGGQGSGRGQAIELSRAGEYAAIDVTLANETLHLLNVASGSQKLRVIDRITSAPGDFAPPVLCLLGSVLFRDGRQEEGAFWFYAGQLRARFDANRCADISARQAVSVLGMEYGAPINQYMMGKSAVLEALIPKVVEWDKTTPRNYDHRWINLHGMGAVRASLGSATGGGSDDANAAVLSLPREQWDGIAEKTRSDYLSGFEEAMAELKKKRP